MLKNKQRLLFAAILAAVPFTVQANIAVDGNIDDWIAMPVINNHTQQAAQWDQTGEWDPLRNTTSYVIADTDDNNNNIYSATNGTENNSKLTGSSGGQVYDGEAMYLEVQNNTLHIAIVTGLDPNNTSWSAGDIFFDLNGDIKSTDFSTPTNVSGHTAVTATSGDGYEYGLTVIDHTDNNSYVDSNDWAAGSLHNVTEWNLAGVTDHDDPLHPVSGKSGTSVDGAETDLAYNDTIINGIGPFDYSGGGDPWAENDHYVIEASISLIDSNNPGQYNAFGLSLISSLGSNGNDINVHWNPLCNNDWIQFTGSLAYNPPSSNSIPEPAPLALMAIGFIGMAARKKYKTNQ